MPNWCTNTVTFSGEEKKLKKIEELMTALIKEQEITGLGVLPKFLIEKKFDQYMFDIIKLDTGVYMFNTSWTPNVKELVEIANKYNCDMEVDYEERGVRIYGKSILVDGNYTEWFLNYDDFDKYSYDDEEDMYKFEDRLWEGDAEILETLLERKM